MMSLREHQSAFLRDIATLITFAFEHPDVQLTAGDFWAHDGHMARSLHYERLAADLNLFVKTAHDTEPNRFVWKYVNAEHPMWNMLGAKWLSLSPNNRWGGDFAKRDYNHFSRAIDERA